MTSLIWCKRGLWAVVCLSAWLKISYAEVINPHKIFPAISNKQISSSRFLPSKGFLPTNSWFINFALGQKNNTPSMPVNTFPYLMELSNEGISLSYSPPTFYSEPAYPHIVSAVYYAFTKQITLGSQELMPNYGLSSSHGLVVNVLWQNKQQQMLAPIVQGSPYLTIYFKEAIPQLSSKFIWLAINNKTTKGNIAPTSRIVIKQQINKTHLQTWILYTQNPIQFKWYSDKENNKLVAFQPYSGWIRLVLQQDTITSLNNNAAILDKFSNTIPLDYKQNYFHQKKQIIYTWEWLTQNQQAPLMLSLPHQRTAAVSYAPISYFGIKGLMQGETKKKWQIALSRPNLNFLEKKKSNLSQTQFLRQALKADAKNLLTYPFEEDGPYRMGKRLARAAQLLLLAEQLGERDTQKKILLFLQSVLTKAMCGKLSWHFQYDTTWGGIIPNVDDYGARHYNDHHYHYGYWVYAFAVIAKLDGKWLIKAVSSSSSCSFTPAQWIEALIRDYANPYERDPYFPFQRYQDDYAGHSWASGLRAFVDGQNEQSSSEAVNAYYALALYGKAIHNKLLMSWGQFLTAREIMSAKLYWQIQPINKIYSEKFTRYNWVVANLWGSKVDANAFFVDCKKEYRCGLAYSFGIEMLPFTAITRFLLSKDWLKQAKPTIEKLLSNQYGKITNAWRWLLIKGMAPVLSPKEKYLFFKKAVASSPEEYDNGDSKTNTLYFLIND